MSLIASSTPIPKDSATFPAMKSWRGSAIAVVDPYAGDRENSANGCRAPFRHEICRERQANAPATTRRPTSATEFLRAEVLLERALSADPSVTHLTGRSRVSNALVNGLSTATLRRVSSRRALFILFSLDPTEGDVPDRPTTIPINLNLMHRVKLWPF